MLQNIKDIRSIIAIIRNFIIMKNFVFPQLFQPIVGEVNLNNFQLWQKTSKRLQSQAQIKNNSKSSRGNGNKFNLLLLSTKSNICNKQTSKTLRCSSDMENLYQLGKLNNNDNFKFQSTKRKQLEKNNYNNANLQISQKNNFRISKQKIRPLNQAKNKKSSLKVQFSHTQNNQYQHQIKGQSTLIQKKKQNVEDNKQNCSPNNNSLKRIKKQKNKQHKVTFDAFKKETNHELKSQVTISQRSNKNRSKKSIGSSKKIITYSSSSKKMFSSQKKRRGGGIQKMISLKEELHQQKIEPKQSNQKINFQKNLHHSHQSNHNKFKISVNNFDLQLQSECEQYNPFDKSNISVTSIRSGSRLSRRMTFHVFQNIIKQVRLQKSCTVWDLNKQPQNKDQVLEKQQDEKHNQKRKKKVHFGRTSIELNEKDQKLNQKQVSQPTSQRKMKMKRAINRSNQYGSIPSIGQLQNNKQKNKFINGNKAQVKKRAKQKKNLQQNVYNQLNYLRMRLNISKKQQEETQVIKPYPQVIILSIDRVVNQLQQQRIQRTKMNNMMIDLGVKLTKDFTLKQTNFKDKAKNYLI